MHNPLESYRRTQRELRHEFEAFTRANCPTCPTPCCRRPARILPTDIVLAESIGWRNRLPATQSSDSESQSLSSAVETNINNSEGDDETPESLPCEYLGERGCTFPTDLRPFGCTTFICKYMYQRLDKATLARIKRLTRDLEDKHRMVLRIVRNVQWRNED